MAELIVLILSVYIFSYIFRFTIFRKSDFPKKQILSIFLSYPFVGIIFAFVRAYGGGEVNFKEAFIFSGWATFLIIAIYSISNILFKKQDFNDKINYKALIDKKNDQNT